MNVNAWPSKRQKAKAPKTKGIPVSNRCCCSSFKISVVHCRRKIKTSRAQGGGNPSQSFLHKKSIKIKTLQLDDWYDSLIWIISNNFAKKLSKVDQFMANYTELCGIIRVRGSYFMKITHWKWIEQVHVKMGKWLGAPVQNNFFSVSIQNPTHFTSWAGERIERSRHSPAIHIWQLNCPKGKGKKLKSQTQNSIQPNAKQQKKVVEPDACILRPLFVSWCLVFSNSFQSGNKKRLKLFQLVFSYTKLAIIDCKHQQEWGRKMCWFMRDKIAVDVTMSKWDWLEFICICWRTGVEFGEYKRTKLGCRVKLSNKNDRGMKNLDSQCYNEQ